MSSNGIENSSERLLLTAESQAPAMSQENQMETDSQTEDGEASKVSNKRTMDKRSDVWNFFKVVMVPESESSSVLVKKAKCIYCQAKLDCHSKKNGTSGLRYHMKVCKKNPLNSQKTVLTYIPPDGGLGDGVTGTLKNWNFNQEAVRKALAQMVMVDELPFRFVERVGFQHFMQVACPLFSIPSRWTLGRDCYMLYEEERSKLKAFLKKSAQRVCLTTDTWTSLQRVNYLCLTVHFIDDNWNLNKRILNFVPISSHRGEDIGIVIESCLADWGITNVFTITVDNAASNSTAIAYLKKKLTSRNGCVLQGKYLHMRCIAHIVNLVVVDGLKNLKHSISRIRNAVRYVRQSPSRWEKFKECIVLEKIESKSHVCLDVRTRWNSTYLMLESAIKFESAFERLELYDPFFAIELGSKSKGKVVVDANGDEIVINNEEESENLDDDSVGVPSKLDWENARKFVDFLRHFYTLTVRVSGSKYVTSNTFFIEISGVLYSLKDMQQSTDVGMARMATKMREKYDKYWGDAKKMNLLIYFAVVLDPRYKMEYLEWTLKEIFKSGMKGNESENERDNENEAMVLKEMVEAALFKMFNEYVRINNGSVGGRKEGSATSKLQSNVDGGVGITEGCSRLTSLYMMHKSRAHIEENRIELDHYLIEESECLSTDFDILSWWKMHSPRFPILSQMARDILAVPISTVASESAFSTSGCILDAFRSSLTPRIVQALICTQDWIRSRTSQSHMCVEEDIADIEKLDEDLGKCNQEERVDE